MSLKILVALTVIFCTVEAHRIYHRIHVPTKVKTIYHTKIIKVPEHHHYIHEKEKYVPIETHHHHTTEHKTHHHKSSYSNLKDDDIGLEYEQADSYEPLDNDFDFESIKSGHDHFSSGSRKVPKVQKNHRARPRKVKHKIIKLPPN